MRKVDFVCGVVLLTAEETGAETVFENPSPAKVWPCAAVMQKSRLGEKSTSASEDGVSERVDSLSGRTHTTPLSTLLQANRDSNNEKMSMRTFMNAMLLS